MTILSARSLSVAVVLLLMAGCSVHQTQPVTPPGPLPESFIESAPAGTWAVEPENWWEVLEDEELNRLMDRAFADNPDLDIAFARLEQSRAIAAGTRAAESPFLNLEARGSHEETPGFSGDSRGNGYRLALAAGYEIDLWNRLGSRTRASSFDAEASLEDLKSLFLSLSAQVADLYYLAIEQRAQLTLARDTVRSFSDTLELVERRYREGLAPPLDVYQARQNLAAAQSQEPLREASLARAEHALAVLLGAYPERGISGDLVELPDAPHAFPAGLPSKILENRPDVRTAFLRVQAADARVAAAIANRFPSLNLLASYGSSRVPFGADAISGTFWGLIINVAQSVFDGGARNAEVDRSRAAFTELLRAYHKTVLTAFREVEDALSQNRATERRIAFFAQRAEAAEAALRLSLDRYTLGLSEYLQVLSAQGLNFDAQSRLIAERRQLISDRISLARALGGSWMAAEMERRYSSIQEYEGRNP